MDRLNDAVARILSVKLVLGVAKLKPKAYIRDKVEEVKPVEMPSVSATT